MPSHPAPAAPHAHRPLAMLGGLTPAEFLRGYWQKRPLLIRSAFPSIEPVLSRARLFALARRADVESRLVVRGRGRKHWTVTHGPFARSSFPPVERPRWTLLVQGVDLHDDAAHALLGAFRFLPDARLDDLMISWASDGGGVGPHVDSYDVFLLQVQGRRRWRIGRQANTALVQGAPLKLLERFAPDEAHVLGPGDMLYLPPAWAHDGTAEGGDCMTYSIGFRAPRQHALAAELVQRLTSDAPDDTVYADPRLAAGVHPARMPSALQDFARQALRELSERPADVACALGEILTETKPAVLFDEPQAKWAKGGAIVLDRRTRMLYDARYVFINGDSVRATGEDARLLRRLADDRRLGARDVRASSAAARQQLRAWFEAGWLHREPGR